MFGNRGTNAFWMFEDRVFIRQRVSLAKEHFPINSQISYGWEVSTDIFECFKDFGLRNCLVSVSGHAFTLVIRPLFEERTTSVNTSRESEDYEECNAGRN